MGYNFCLKNFVLDKMSLLRLRVGYMEQFALFKTLSKADKIPKFCSCRPLVPQYFLHLKDSNPALSYATSTHAMHCPE